MAEAQGTIDSLSIEEDASLDPARLNRGYEALKLAYTGDQDQDIAPVAKTENEQADVKQLRDELEAKEKEVQAAVDERYRAEVAAFREELTRLDPDAAGYSGQLSAHKTKAQNLKAKKWISLGLSDQSMDPILTQIDGLIEQDQVARAEAGYLAKIRAGIGNPNAYRLELNAYVEDQRFTGTPRQRHFQQVLQNETALWVGHEDWSRLKTDLNGTNLANYNPEYAPQLVMKATAVLDQHKGFPEETALQGIVAYLNLLVLREQETLQKAVMNVVDQQIIRSLYMLEAKDGAENQEILRHGRAGRGRRK